MEEAKPEENVGACGRAEVETISFPAEGAVGGPGARPKEGRSGRGAVRARLSSPRQTQSPGWRGPRPGGSDSSRQWNLQPQSPSQRFQRVKAEEGGPRRLTGQQSWNLTPPTFAFPDQGPVSGHSLAPASYYWTMEGNGPRPAEAFQMLRGTPQVQPLVEAFPPLVVLPHLAMQILPPVGLAPPPWGCYPVHAWPQYQWAPAPMVPPMPFYQPGPWQHPWPVQNLPWIPPPIAAQQVPAPPLAVAPQRLPVQPAAAPAGLPAGRPAPPPPPQQPPRFRAAFDGSPGKLANFLSRIRAHVDQYGHLYPSDRELVSAIGDGLKEGDASDLLARMRQEGAPELEDIEGFIQLLTAHFEDRDRVAANEDKLMEMKQGAQPLKDFVGDFERAAGALRQWPERILLHYFKEAIDQEVRRACEVRGVPERLQDWCDMAIKVDREIYPHHKPPAGKPARRPLARGPPISPPEPCPTPAPGTITCYRCGQQGHGASECLAAASPPQPQPAPVPSRRNPWGKPPDTGGSARQAAEFSPPTREARDLLDLENFLWDSEEESDLMWAYELGHSNEEPVSIPLHACEHFYLLTRPLKSPLESSTPTIVDLDGRIYIRSWQGGILSGGFEKNPKPIFTEGKNQLEIHNLQEDWDHFEPLLGALLRRMPDMEALEIMQLVNCPESFTPDMRCIMGESPTRQGYFVLAGMNATGISFGGGAGKYLAEWMVNGYPSDNVWPLDLKRFGALQSSRTFLRHRVMEVMPLIYDLKVPRWDFQTGRQLRTSPLYDRLDAQGARWMEKHGFERAKFFVPPGKDLLALDQSKTFYKPDWFDIVGAEVKCCKEAVGVIDMSSFTKFEISSTGGQALGVLQYLFSNDLNVPVGHIVHTGMLNHHGGYENDCSIARLNKHSFFMISPTDQQVHCWAWLKKHMPDDGNLFLEDVTWKYTALNLIGPRAMDVLSELSYAPMTPDHFPSLFCKEMSVGYANGIRVMSMTHTGEPGFMLYIPIEYALHVYNEVMSVGQKYGIRNSGYYALRSLRIEKFFAFWGQDLDAFTTPMECGREFRVKLDKGMDFIGRDALMAQKQEGVYKRFTMFILEDHNTDLDLWPWWGEPIYRNGCFVGKTTSSAYSYTLERHVCLGFVQNLDPRTGMEHLVTPDFVNRGEYEIDIAGQRFQAKAKLYPFSSLFTSRRRKDEMEFSGFQGK